MRIVVTALITLLLGGSSGAAQSWPPDPPIIVSGTGVFPSAPSAAGFTRLAALTAGAFSFRFQLPALLESYPGFEYPAIYVQPVVDFTQGGTTTSVLVDVFLLSAADGGLFDFFSPFAENPFLLKPRGGPQLYVPTSEGATFLRGTWIPTDPRGEAYPGQPGFGSVTRVSITSTAPAVVPEPSTYVLLGTGLVAIGIAARRRRVGGRVSGRSAPP